MNYVTSLIEESFSAFSTASKEPSTTVASCKKKLPKINLGQRHHKEKTNSAN